MKTEKFFKRPPFHVSLLTEESVTQFERCPAVWGLSCFIHMEIKNLNKKRLNMPQINPPNRTKLVSDTQNERTSPVNSGALFPQ